MNPEALVYFACVKERSKLRVRITSPGYNPEANCQFPRAIRADGKTFTAPVSAISFARGPQGKFFYRVKPKAIVEVDPEDEHEEEVGNLEANRAEVLRALGIRETKTKVKAIYQDDSEECVVCFDESKEVVLVPCGHYCLCGGCAHQVKETTKVCPLCRAKIEKIVTRDEIQIG